MQDSKSPPNRRPSSHLQQLRDTINNRFEDVNNRFEDINLNIDNRIQGINLNIDDRVQNINANIVAVEGRLTTRITRNSIARIQNSTRNMGVSPISTDCYTFTEESEAGTVPDCRTRLLIAIGLVKLSSVFKFQS